jgi:hypothetical protein
MINCLQDPFHLLLIGLGAFQLGYIIGITIKRFIR